MNKQIEVKAECGCIFMVLPAMTYDYSFSNKLMFYESVDRFQLCDRHKKECFMKALDDINEKRTHEIDKLYVKYDNIIRNDPDVQKWRKIREDAG